ncbi:MAG: hypothetical protein AAFR61_18185 [Bacteroidota bacterium]
MSRPVAFLACVNDVLGGKKTKSWRREKSRVARYISRKRHPFSVESVQMGKKGISPNFFEAILDRRIRESITILHLCGPSESDHLRIETPNQMIGVHVDELSKLIGKLPNLKMVFLSGCATRGLIEMFIKRDIPAVFAIQDTHPNTRSQDIVKELYEQLVKGQTLAKVARYISHRFVEFQEHRLGYEVEKDLVSGIEDDLLGALPWGMYYLRDNALRLDQSPALVDPFRTLQPESWLEPVPEREADYQPNMRLRVS